ncbi:hypothetical protein N8E86_08010 [Avibacterium paragallinarum]|uniref:hypothetical protein n=1 Tax=Avibacterium paragallinarum TaxID=728 RepID=UPI0021F7EFFF|nr:hypothetical protein [Avibacterium paragallinarum]UXN34021.1 hypothetical protein N8E86_08010 [Avibacterium paragallinarum]
MTLSVTFIIRKIVPNFTLLAVFFPVQGGLSQFILNSTALPCLNIPTNLLNYSLTIYLTAT